MYDYFDLKTVRVRLRLPKIPSAMGNGESHSAVFLLDLKLQSSCIFKCVPRCKARKNRLV